MQSSSTVRAARGRAFAILFALSALSALLAAPTAMAWHGDLVVRKVNVGGPSTDQFGFKVEKSAYANGTYGPYGTLATSAYTGASFNGAAKPPNPFTLLGSTDGTFKTGPTGATQASFTYLDADGESAIPTADVRDWNRFKVTETSKPAGYRTAVACVIANKGSGKPWSPTLDAMWGPWTATVSGDSVWTTVRWLPDTAGYDYKGQWRTTCTFTNTYRTRIRLIKDFVNAPGDAKVDFTVNGGDVDTSADAETFGDGDGTGWIEVDGGSNVALAESGTPTADLSDYEQKLECRKGTNGSYGSWFVVANGTLSAVHAGRDYECRFTNTRRTGTIQVLKFTDPASITSGFDLRVDGAVKAGDVGNGGDTGAITVPLGSHAVSETAAGGGAITGFSSKAFCANNPSGVITAAAFQGTGSPYTEPLTVNVAEGDRWVCAFLNTKASTSTFKVIKRFEGPSGTDTVAISVNGEGQDVVTPQDSPRAGTPSFGDGDGTQTFTVPAGGSVRFGESGLEGTDLGRYDVTVECSDQDQQPVSVTLDGDWYVNDIPAGTDVVCTIYNTRQSGRITLKKILRPAGSGAFHLKLDGENTSVAGSDGDTTFGDQDQTDAIQVATGTHAVAEMAAEGTNPDDFVMGAPVCVNRIAEVETFSRDLPVAEVPVQVDEEGRLDVTPGSDILCTFTNEQKGTVIIKKVTSPAGADAFAFSGDLGAFSVTAGTEGQAFKVAPGKSYAVTEDPANLYAFGGAVCEESSAGDGEASGVSGTTATANVQPGETVTCTFTNNRIPRDVPVTPSGTVSPSGDVAPVTPSGGVTVRKGNARISGTVGCVSSTYAVAAVRGSSIRRVTFFVNGRKVRTLTKPNSGSQFRYRARSGTLAYGAYRVRAKVEFVAASGTKAKTLSLQFSRCKPRVVRPQFTG
jgi:hypothetical protein